MVGQAAGGVVFEKLREYPALRETLAGQAHDRRSRREHHRTGEGDRKAGAAAQRGTNNHIAWEHRGKTGELNRHLTDPHPDDQH